MSLLQRDWNAASRLSEEDSVWSCLKKNYRKLLSGGQRVAPVKSARVAPNRPRQKSDNLKFVGCPNK